MLDAILTISAWSVILLFVAAFVAVGGYIVLSWISEAADRYFAQMSAWRIMGLVGLVAFDVWCFLDALRLL